MTDYFEQHFRFPIILVNGIAADAEDSIKRIIGKDEEEADYPDYVIGYAKMPYKDYSHSVEMWMPTEESYLKAKDEDIFEAAIVTFDRKGSFYIPMTVKEFEASLNEFVSKYEISYEQKLEEFEKRLQEKFPELNVKLLKNVNI